MLQMKEVLLNLYRNLLQCIYKYTDNNKSLYYRDKYHKNKERLSYNIS